MQPPKGAGPKPGNGETNEKPPMQRVRDLVARGIQELRTVCGPG